MTSKKVSILVLDLTLKGGIERFVANFANMLVRAGLSVSIYSIHQTNNEPLYEIDPKVRVVYVNNIGFQNSLYKFTTLLGCIKLLKDRDLWDTHHSVVSTHPITTIYLHWLRANLSKVIASEHSAYMSHGRLIRFFRKLAYKKVNTVIAQTEDGVRHFKDVGIDAIKIYNSTTNFNDSQQWSLPSKQLPEFICLTVARLESVKKLEDFINIASRVNKLRPEVKFAIVGDGSEEAMLKTLTKKLKLENIITFYEPTPKVSEYYAKASAYLITSDTESFSMTMVEAMSYSVPVISYDDLVGPKEVINDETTGFLVKRGNLELFSRVICKLYDNRDSMDFRTSVLSHGKQFQEEEVLKNWIKVL